MATGEVTLQLINAFVRLIDLLADEKDIPILAPLIQREIVYRLLVGDQGERLRQIATAGSQSQQICGTSQCCVFLRDAGHLCMADCIMIAVSHASGKHNAVAECLTG